MTRGRWITLALTVGLGACRGNHLSGVSQVLTFASPDDPGAVDQTDAGVRIDFGQVVVATTKTLTLQFSSLGTTGTLGSLVAIEPDPEFDLPFVPGTPIGPAPSSIRVSFSPTTLGAKSAVFQLSVDVAAVETVTVEVSGTSVSNGLTVTPSPLDFGRLEIGQAVTQALTITNTGDVPVNLDVSDLAIIDAGIPDAGPFDAGPPENPDGGPPFSLGSPSASTLAPGATATLDATFAPERIGPVSASFFLNGYSASPFLMTGVGIESSLVIESPLDYGFVQIGETMTKPIVIRNLSDSQTYNLTTFPQFSEDQVDSSFLLPYPAPEFPQAIAPNSSLLFPLFFEPGYLGFATEDAAFFSDDPRALVLDVTLTGWGGGPHIECQSPLVFGPVAVGYGVTLPVTCVNAGANIPNHPQFTLQLSQASLVADNPDFTAMLFLPDGGAASSDAGVLLAAGEKTRIEVTFTPPDAGVVHGELHVATNNPDDFDAGVLLEGEGVVPGLCDLGLTPQPLVFTEVPQGTQAVLQFGIENLGHDYCILTDVTLDPASDPAYSVVSPNPPYRLLSFAGNTDNPRNLSTVARADVQFAPTKPASLATGSVEVTVKNAVPPTQAVDLTGVCQAACLTIAPSSRGFGTVGLSPTFNRICQPDSQSFTVTNSCQGQVTIQDLVLDPRLDAPPQFEMLNSPAVPITLDAGDEVGFEVGFVPTVTGDTVESVDLTSSEYPSTPYLISLRGDAEYQGTETDTFVAPLRQIDIAWIIEEDQDYPIVQDVRALIPDLFASLAEGQVDYQMAFTSTDTCVGPHSDQGWFEPCDHCLSTAASNPFFLTPADPDPTTTMAGILDTFDVPPEIGYCAQINGGEHFFDSIALAFATPLLQGHNAGFIRPDAYLAIVVVNGVDEDDGADAVNGYGKDYLTSELQARNLVRSLKPNASMVSVSYINAGLDAFSQAASAKIGKLVSNTGGVEVNVNQLVGKIAFLNLLADVANLGVYHLTTPAIYTGPFVVTVDGAASDSWTYDRDTNSIAFAPGSIPPPGSVITVTYPFGCL